MRSWGRFYKNIAVIFSGNMIAHLVVIISTPVLVRFFLPEEFGLYQLFLSFTGISSMLATGKYELAIITPKHDYLAIALALVTTVISFCLSLLIGMVAFLCVDNIDLMKPMYFSGVSVWIGVFTFVLCLYQILYMLLIRQALYKNTVVSNLIYSVGCVVLPILFVHFSINDGLIKGMVISKIIACLYIVLYVKRLNFKYNRRMNVCFFIRVLKRYDVFLKYALPGNILNTLASNAPAFFLSNFYGMAVTGYYSMASRCVMLPIALASKSVGDVFKQEASKVYQQFNECHIIFNHVMKILLKGSFMYSLFILFLAPLIVVLLLGEEWRTTGEYIRFLLLVGATGLVYSPLSSIFDIAAREYEYMILQGCSLVLVVIVLFICGHNLSVELTLSFYSLAVSIVNIAGLMYCKRISKGGF